MLKGGRFIWYYWTQTLAYELLEIKDKFIFNGQISAFRQIDKKAVHKRKINKKTNKKIAACMPMHTFGFPVHLDELILVCSKWNIPIVEDAAESIGSEYNNKPTGSFGKLGVFSFNGNKIITTSCGGALLSENAEMIEKARFLATQARDLQSLTTLYKIEKVQPVDMFPHTHHIENVVLLSLIA